MSDNRRFLTLSAGGFILGSCLSNALNIFAGHATIAGGVTLVISACLGAALPFINRSYS